MVTQTPHPKDHDLKDIRTSIFAVKLYCSCIVSESSLFLGRMVPKMVLNSVKVDVGSPKTVPSIPTHSLVLRGGQSLLATIRLILSTRAYTKINSSIIQFIAVNMIRVKALGGIHYKPMKQILPPLAAYLRIRTNVISAVSNTPLILRNPLEVLGIYQSVSAIGKLKFHLQGLYHTNIKSTRTLL